MKLSDRIAVPAHVMARQVGDDMVVLDLQSGTYYGLNELGSRIWHLLAQGNSPATACEVLQKEYEVAPAVLEKDLVALLVELQTRGLVQVS